MIFTDGITEYICDHSFLNFLRCIYRNQEEQNKHENLVC